MGSGEIFDVTIVGGGVMGSSTAYHLAAAEPALKIACVERDPGFSRASSSLSVGNARIQFSLEENVRISQYAFDAFERFADEMAVDGVAPEISFRREGNLFLVGAQERDQSMDALRQQARLGCEVEWWERGEIRRRFPELDPGRCVGATWGAGDGHLDGYALLMGYRQKARALGASLITGEATAITTRNDRVTGVRLASGDTVASGSVVCCAGAWCGELLASCGVEVPVSAVQRQVYVVEPAVRPAERLPLVSLPSGLYFRSEGERRLLVGRSMADDPVGIGFAWSAGRFDDHLWPALAAVVPAFDRLRLLRGWTGLYAVNTMDGNALLGEWPELEGLFLANGFSGHGLQQAPAVGRYLAECVLRRPPALDLSIFSPDRVLTGRPVSERALV